MSVRSLNKVMLIGNLTRDPNMRFTPNNTAVCTFSIATNRSWMPADGGEKQEKADFHNIVAWSKLAEVCGQLLKKGHKVYVEGRLQTREWQNKEGQQQRTTEVVIDNMILLTSRGDGGMREDYAADQSAVPATAPAKKSPAKASAKKTEEANEDVTVSDDVSGVEDLSEDIPF